MLIVGEFQISNTPTYQKCTLSIVGAVSGVLKSLGRDYDVVDVSGYSGWSFIINITKGKTCPSSVFCIEDWDDTTKGMETLGCKICMYRDPESYEYYSGEPSDEERERAKKFFEQVKKELETKDKPVIIWGIPHPEYAIVYGYKDDTYLASSSNIVYGNPDVPFKYDELKAPGGLQYFTFSKELEVDSDQRDKEAITRAIRRTEGGQHTDESGAEFISGPEALIEWAAILKKGEVEALDYLGNGYIATVAFEGRSNAVEFLKRLAERYKDRPQSEQLTRAADAFAKTQAFLRDYLKVFPYTVKGEMTEEKRRQGAKLLLKAKPHELKAIEHLQEAQKIWN